MVKKERISKPITITLSPQAQEALGILKIEEETVNVSYIVDKAIKNHLQGLGYLERDEVFNQVKVELISNQIVLPKFQHQEQTFVQVPGTKSQYTIRLSNTSYKRKLVVVAVDGRSVMTGELASEKDQGYVLEPGQTMDLTGWRRTADEVAAFEFVDLEQSYDKQVGGTGSNVGVIGVAVFDEKVVDQTQYWNHWVKKRSPYEPIPMFPPPYTWESTGDYSLDHPLYGSATLVHTGYSGEIVATNAVVSNSAGTTLTSEIVGTGYGEKKAMPTVSVSFDRADSPIQKIVLRYATEATLKKWGVIKESPIPEVNPFPNQKIAVPAPPGWRG